MIAPLYESFGVYLARRIRGFFEESESAFQKLKSVLLHSFHVFGVKVPFMNPFSSLLWISSGSTILVLTAENQYCFFIKAAPLLCAF